jgi:hypothetical protein
LESALEQQIQHCIPEYKQTISLPQQTVFAYGIKGALNLIYY